MRAHINTGSNLRIILRDSGSDTTQRFFDKRIDVAQTTSSFWILDIACTLCRFDLLRNLQGRRALARLRNLIFDFLPRPIETIANRRVLTFVFVEDGNRQFADRERAHVNVREIDDRTIRVGTIVVLHRFEKCAGVRLQ